MPGTIQTDALNGEGGQDLDGHDGVSGHGLDGNGHSGNGHSGNGHSGNGHNGNGHNGNGHNGHDSFNGHNGHGSLNGNGNGTNGHDDGFNGHSNGHNGHSNGTSKQDEPIAICGMACRLPGGIASPQSLWDFLITKQDGRSRVPESRYNTDAFSSTTGKPGTTRTDYGYFLSDDLRTFDASRFHMSVKELERLDPQQRLLLHVAQECVDDAGETDTSGARIGVYVGDMQRGWSDVYEKESQNYGTYHLLGLDDFALANRVSYEMNLKGPSVTVRAACASSLCALNDACKAISSGECDGAIVGGASIILGPSTTIQVGEQGALAPDGSCKAFSAKANGYARAEAVSAVYVKPLSAAIRDGNPVRAVVRAVASNHNGRVGGITAPSVAAQQDLIRQAYEAAGIGDLSETAFVECHGTGTPAGDPVETEAVGSVFGGGMYIGSVKPNLGHSEGASGMTSLLKAVLALENKTIPPNIKFDVPNPDIPFDKYQLTVPVEPVPWPAGRKERVSVNNFGIGGVNAHVILDSADSFHARPRLEEAGDHPQLLVYSAASPESLGPMAENHAAYLAKHPERIEDVAYTLANRREHMPHRAFVVASREKPGAPSPAAKPPAGPPQVIMVFTGQGAQWPQMGRDLIRSNKTFKASIQAMDAQLKKLGADWTIEGELKKTAKTSRVGLAEFSQPLCTAVQVALVDALAAVGIKPSAVVGHSSGEIAGAYAAGALSIEDAIVAAYHRGAVAGQQTRAGGMAAIGLGWKDVDEFLVPNVGVACENSPRSVTLSGDADKVAEVVEAISRAHPDVLARLLKINKAYHSYHMAEVGPLYFDLVGPQVGGRAPAIPFFSSVEGRLLGKADELGAAYWQKNLESRVLFKDAVAAIARHPVAKNAVFLEIGPHSALAGPLRQILAEHADVSQSPYVASMLRGQHCTESLLTAIGKLYALHVPVDFKAMYPAGTTTPDLPPYPWNNARVYWHETRVMKEWRERRFKHHDLLGLRTLESTDLDPVWRNLFHLDNAPWVRDHVINGDVVFPFAAYIAMAGEAIRQTTGVEEGFRLRNITATTALVVPDESDKPVEMITSFRRSGNQRWDFTIASHNGHGWIQHFNGEASALSGPLGASEPAPELPRAVDAAEWYGMVGRTGFHFGPTFRCIENLKASTVGQGRATATIRNLQGEESNYHMHPTAVDNVFQLLPVASLLGLGWKLGLNIITSIAELSVTACSSDVTASVTGGIMGNGSIVGGGECTFDGQTVLRLSGTSISVLGQLDVDTHAAARHIWAPHVDFGTQLLKPLENGELAKLTDLALAYTNQVLREPDDRYGAWVRDASPSVDLDSPSVDMVNDKAQGLSGSPVADIARAIATVAAGHLSKRDAVVGHDLLAKMSAIELDSSPLIRTLAHSKPNLRVLELNAGSGSQTAKYLQDLQGRYSRYTFADAGRDLVAEGRESFKDHPNMEFVELDIGGDLEALGFDGQYDLIIAVNAVHQTGNLSRTLSNIRSLLGPRGRLLLQELVPSSSKWVDFVMGVLPSWWDKPRLDTQAWEVALRDAGLSAVDPQMNALVAKPLSEGVEKQVAILTVDVNADISAMSAQLAARGYDVSHITLDDAPPGRDIIALLDGDGPFLGGMSPEAYGLFNRFVSRLGSGLFWVTRLSIRTADAHYAQVVGLARALRAELDVDFAVCQTETTFADAKVIDVFEHFHLRYANADQDSTPEMEYAVYDGQVNVGRYYPFTLAEEQRTADEGDKAVLTIPRAGHLNELKWKSCAVEAPQGGEVEVAVYAAGLNDKDLANALGTSGSNKPIFGLEAAGIVRRVGPRATRLRVGDRVVLLGTETLSTTTKVEEQLAVRIPQTLSFVDAATMPFAFVTALHALLDLGRLESGQSVLIHGASHSVGIAALQVAQMVGADVFVTVDAEAEAQLDAFDLPRGRIFSDAEGIMRETRGQGVDLVLAASDGLDAAWSCVAECGTMVATREPGSRLDMSGRGFIALDLDRLRSARPAVAARHLQTVMKLYREGRISPIRPAKVFPAAEAAAAFGSLDQGKVVVEVAPEASAERDIQRDTPLPVAERERDLSFNPKASYVLVGGFGGIGRQVAIWLAEHGAGNIVFLSRSAGTAPSHDALIRELRSMGVGVQAVRGSVDSLDDVARAVRGATYPVRGIVQMSMVLRDAAWAAMTHDDWVAATDPKVKGTWNLHQAAQDAGAELDFFVMFSSIATVVGTPGQTNYAAANAFLDAFAQYRVGLGLPASTINVGVVEDVGVVARDAELLRGLKTMGFVTIRGSDVLDAMSLAVRTPSPKAAADGSSFVHPSVFAIGLGSTTPLSSPDNRVLWRRDPRMAVYRNSSAGAAQASRNDGLKTLLAAARADKAVLETPEAAALLAVEIGSKVLALLGKPADSLALGLSLSDLGMDSLVGIEMRKWWKTAFGFEISLLEMLGMGTLELLGKHAAARLSKMMHE